MSLRLAKGTVRVRSSPNVCGGTAGQSFTADVVVVRSGSGVCVSVTPRPKCGPGEPDSEPGLWVRREPAVAVEAVVHPAGPPADDPRPVTQSVESADGFVDVERDCLSAVGQHHFEVRRRDDREADPLGHSNVGRAEGGSGAGAAHEVELQPSAVRVDGHERDSDVLRAAEEAAHRKDAGDLLGRGSIVRVRANSA